MRQAIPLSLLTLVSSANAILSFLFFFCFLFLRLRYFPFSLSPFTYFCLFSSFALSFVFLFSQLFQTPQATEKNGHEYNKKKNRRTNPISHCLSAQFAIFRIILASESETKEKGQYCFFSSSSSPSSSTFRCNQRERADRRSISFLVFVVERWMKSTIKLQQCSTMRFTHHERGSMKTDRR